MKMITGEFFSASSKALLRLLSLSLAILLIHNFWTIDQEEEGTGLVCNRLGHQSLSYSRRAKHENALWWFDTNGLE